MIHNGALTSMPKTALSQPLSMFRRRLTDQQLECLSRCARGISVRFEAWEIVDALVAGGYATEGVARVVTVTPLGRQYLRLYAR